MTTSQLVDRTTTRIRRVAWRLLTGLSRADRLYSFRLPCGARFDYPLDSAIGKYLYSGAFEPAEFAFARNHLKPGDIVLDVGANGGLYTVMAARAVGDTGHVYAFEPGTRALEVLRHNVAINGLKNVTIIPAAVSNSTGQASFAVAADSALSSLADIGRGEQKIRAWTTVDTIRLDDAVERYQIPHVSFIKVDVEGAEKLVFEGSPELLTRASPPFAILFEAFDQNARAFGYTVAELLASLSLGGYSIYGFDRSMDLHPIERFGAEIGSGIYNFVAYKS